MVAAQKDGKIEYIGSAEKAKELVKEGGYTFLDEDTGKAVEDPVPAVEEYSGEHSVQLGFSAEEFIKLCKENGIFITMKE